jgi:hypothetical protein
MDKDRKAEPAADWSDQAMAALVAVLVLGMPLLAFIFR